MDDDQEIEERAELYESLANETRKAFVEDEFRANLSTQEEVAEFENFLADGFCHHEKHSEPCPLPCETCEEECC